jgi:hypothetical protein
MSLGGWLLAAGLALDAVATVLIVRAATRSPVVPTIKGVEGMLRENRGARAALWLFGAASLLEVAGFVLM